MMMMRYIIIIIEEEEEANNHYSSPANCTPGFPPIGYKDAHDSNFSHFCRLMGLRPYYIKRTIMKRRNPASIYLQWTSFGNLEAYKNSEKVQATNLVQGLSQFRHMDYVSEYSVKPQDYTKPRRTLPMQAHFMAGQSIARLDSSRGISSPTLRHQLTNRSKSQQRATTLHGSKKRFIKKRLSAVDINKKIAMDEYKKTIALKESEELRRKREEERRNQQAVRNRGKHASEILRENRAKVCEVVALAKKRVKQRGKSKNDVPQQLLPFGIGKAKNSWFDQHLSKEEDDESLYRIRYNFSFNAIKIEK